MEINLKKLSDQAIESTTGSKNMRLSENATSMVFQLFTKNVYSNPIGTVVREITSNCFDSHTEAHITAPVVIRKSFDNQTNTTSISFIDFGVGMSPDRVENIYGVYFESTKRVDNTQIGGFGIGGKTPLAYKRSTGAGEGEYDNSFYVITVFDKVNYYYCIYEGPESPVISLLHSEPTTEGNGTEVRIPVLPKDLPSFKKEMIRQLYYFENIVFEGFEDETSTDTILNNKYQIVRGKSFLFRGTEYSNYVHVCLGRVAYPLDYSVLGLSADDYQLPVAIRLEVGEIGVTVSRETLDYSESTIKKLKKKLEEIKAELTQMLIKQYDNIVTLEDYFKVKNTFGHVYMPNGEHFNVGEVIKQKDIDFTNFKYSFTKMPTDKQLFKFFFDVKLYGKKPHRSKSWRYNHDSDEVFEGSYEAITKQNALYYFEDEFQRKIIKQAYLKDLHTTYYMLSKKNIARSASMGIVADLFNVHDSIMIDNNGSLEPTTYCQSLLDMQEEFFQIVRDNCTDYNDVDVPQSFIEERKIEKLSQEIRNTTIPIRFFTQYHGSRDRVKLDDLFKANYAIFYGSTDDEIYLKSAKDMYTLLYSDNIISGYNNYYKNFDGGNGKSGIMFIQIAAGNVKYMKYCKKAMHISEFKHKMLHRKHDEVLNYFQTYNFLEIYNGLDLLYKSNEFKNVCPKWGNKIKKLNSFMGGLPAMKKNWGHNKYELNRYFPIDKLTHTKEQLVFLKTIEDLKEMQELNNDVLNYISAPYDFSTAKEAYWNILKKVMVY